MTRRCMVTGKGPLVGNNVSHANNKTKRRFLPSVKTTSIYSEVLGRMVSVKTSTHGIRTIEHKGGLDAYLTGTAPSKLDEALRPIRAEIKSKQGDVKKPVAKKTGVRKTPSARSLKITAARKAAAK
jgi:large subunit ribosomal protein L28